jgi:CRP-like cAMP-binding protein
MVKEALLPMVDLAKLNVVNPVWLAVGDQTRAALLECGVLRSFEAESTLFSEGELSGMAFFPLTGKLVLSKTGRAGRRQTLCHLNPSRCGGPCLLLMGDHAIGDVVAVEDGTVLLVKRQDMEQLAVQDPVLGRIILRGVVRCMEHFVSVMENLSFNKVAQRVALALLDQTNGNGSGFATQVRQTQAELAAEVGTTREVVARCLAELQDVGAIKLGRGRITILDRSLLEHAG